MRFGLYPRCLPYEGPVDAQRRWSIQQYLQRALGPSSKLSGFAEEPIRGSSAVQPRVWLYYECGQSEGQFVDHQQAIVTLEEVLKTVGLHFAEAVLTEVVGSGLHGAVLGGGIFGALGAGAAGTPPDSGQQTKSSDQVAIAALASFALGALFGALVGSQIMRDGQVIGFWSKQPSGLWHLSPPEEAIAMPVFGAT